MVTHTIQSWLLIASGGVCGTLARYALATVVARALGATFPYGTFVVNIVGAFLVGVVAAVIEQHSTGAHGLRLFWMVGVLGAFTTFSTLIYESWLLVQQGNLVLFGLNLFGSMALGFLAFWLGASLVSLTS